MHLLLLALAALLLLPALFGVGYWCSARRLPVVARNLAGAALSELIAERDHARAQWEMNERRAEEFRALNSSVLIERDKWQQLYWDQVSGHGNAQALMMGTIEALANQLRALGKKVEIPAVIRTTLDDFTERHVNTVPSKSGTAQIPRPPPEPPQVPDTTSTERAPVPES